jgi:superfamily II DNA or RNA helicase
MTFKLRPYQKDAFEAILASWGEHRSVICNLPTGLGKTAVAAAVMHDRATSGSRS